MALYCVIFGKEIPVSKFKYDIQQDTIEQFDVTLPTRFIAGTQPYLQDIQVYRDGQVIITGIVKTPTPYPELQDSISNPLLTTLKCDGEIGRLGCEAAINQHFQDVTITSALNTLLSGTLLSSWVLGDTSTLSNIKITIDPRDRESLWVQIQDVIKASNTPTFVRYGGVNGLGQHQLDVGSFFNRDSSQFAIIGRNVIGAPSINEPSSEPIKLIYPLSGDSADTPVNLDDALNIDPTLSNPAQDYQILAGLGAVQNNTILLGCHKRMSFDIHKPENDEEPTQDELNEVAHSLYQRAVQELKSTESHLSFTVKIATPNKPVIHDGMYFQGIIYEDDYDLYTEETRKIQSFSLDGWYRVVAIKGDFRDRYEEYDEITERSIPSEVWELELSDGDWIDKYNANELILNKLQRHNKFDNVSSRLGITGTQTVTVHWFNVVGNCNFSGANTGRNFTFVTPTAPSGSTDVLISISQVSPPTYSYIITQNGGIGTNLQLCVQASDGTPWGLADDCTIKVSYLFLR